MNDLIIREWNSRVIRQREDGYLSATDMCQACGKLFADWNRLKATSEYLKALEDDMMIPISLLVEVNKGVTQGSSAQEQGTWVHPLVATNLAQWLLPAFAVRVAKWTNELLTKGIVSLDTLSPGHQLLAQAQAVIALEEQQKQLNLVQQKQAAEIAELKQITADHNAELGRVFNPNGNYYSVMGYWNFKYEGQALSTVKAARIGKQCSNYCRENDLDIERLTDARYGRINSYPESVLALFV